MIFTLRFCLFFGYKVHYLHWKIGVTANSTQGLDAQDRAIPGLSMDDGRVQLVRMRRIEGSYNGPRVSFVISIGYFGCGISV